MKGKVRLQCAAACSAVMLLFSLPKVAQMSTLEELSMPHLGYYTCEQISLGGNDLTDDFLLLRLELKQDGVMLLHIRDRLGKEETKEFSYEYEQGSDRLIVRVTAGSRTVERTLVFEKGQILFTENLGGRLLVAKFSKK